MKWKTETVLALAFFSAIDQKRADALVFSGGFNVSESVKIKFSTKLPQSFEETTCNHTQDVLFHNMLVVFDNSCLVHLCILIQKKMQLLDVLNQYWHTKLALRSGVITVPISTQLATFTAYTQPCPPSADHSLNHLSQLLFNATKPVLLQIILL